ncbi:MAG: hypothetical protein K1X85_14750 [Ignavibacteria bacterium]|nr:hypothetical protein [Ignavibacteria bacterium]
MTEIITKLVAIAAIIAVPATSLGMGLQFEKPHLRLLANHTGMIFRYSLAMFVVMPAIAAVLFYYDIANKAVWGGIFLVSISPIMPSIVGKTGKKDKDSLIKLAWFVIALIYSLFLIPLSLIAVKSVFGLDFDLGYKELFIKLLILFIVPLSAGFLVSIYFPASVASVLRIVNAAGKIAGLVLVVLLLIVAAVQISKLTLISVLLVLGFALLSMIVGVVLGYPERNSGYVLAGSLLMRLPAPAIIFAQINNTVQEHLPVILLYLIIGTLMYKVLDIIHNKKRSGG